MVEYIIANSDDEYVEASYLFKEYAHWLNIDLGFQKFSEELLQIKSMYGSPTGCIILCKSEQEIIGCIAIRKIDPEVAEFKRMYIKPNFRKKGIGVALLQRAISQAEMFGYKRIRLDTLSNMLPAISLYKKNGFCEIPAYYYNPEKTAVYFEKII
ncbi:MAG: GNAT family N-acetyltransferase [Ferruginibacter sp.]